MEQLSFDFAKAITGIPAAQEPPRRMLLRVFWREGPAPGHLYPCFLYYSGDLAEIVELAPRQERNRNAGRRRSQGTGR